MSLDWFKKLRLFVNVRNRKIDVVVKASRAVVIRWFSLNEAPLGLFKFISDYFDRNFCSVHEEITSIRLYTQCNPCSGLRKGVYNLIEVISNESNKNCDGSTSINKALSNNSVILFLREMNVVTWVEFSAGIKSV
jgi:hypothetical protein